MELETLTSRLIETATQNPENGITSYGRRSDLASATYPEVLHRAKICAAALASRDLRPRTLVGIFVPNSLNFFVCYFGCLFARLTPVTLPGPFRVGAFHDRSLQRVHSIVDQSGIAVILDGYSLDTHRFFPNCTIFEVSALVSGNDEIGKTRPVPSAEDLALIQFTSGSISRPKGVMLTHANISINVRLIVAAVNMNPSDTVNVWIPLFHDMGLMGSLAAIVSGASLRICSPDVCIIDPLRWLWKFDKSHSTITPAPHFFYRMMANAYEPTKLRGLDLSRWRVAFNGAEPIRTQDVERFLGLFGPHGFKASAMYPVYGLAESTLASLFPVYGLPPRVILGRQAFGADCPSHCADRRFISVGTALPKHEVRIIRPTNESVDFKGMPDGVGEIELRGPSIMKGYLNDIPSTQAVLSADGWLATGDLGFVFEGEIFIYGRLKETIIYRGTNYCPEDIEIIVDEVLPLPGIRIIERASFAFEICGQEWAAVAIEMKDPQHCDAIIFLRDVRAACLRKIGLEPIIFALKPRAIPKTTSGKLQRHLLGRRLQEGELTPTVVLCPDNMSVSCRSEFPWHAQGIPNAATSV
jgi:fatty-acyl-CoA synthase